MRIPNTISQRLYALILAVLILPASFGTIFAAEDPPFDPLISLQRYQPNYQNPEIIPQNSANTGAAAYSISIDVPPGRNGLQPGLSLNYSSGQKNGWLGMGWTLNIGSIQRSTKKGLDYNGVDFLANGSVELVPRPDLGQDLYGAKIEDAFTRYHFVQDSWEVTTKDGTRYFYGSTADSRQDDGDRIFKWCLDKVEDTNGNVMTFTYIKDQGQIYPERINYTDGLNYVLFFYEETRSDISPMYNTHFEVKTAKRLERIETYGNGQLAKTYTFACEPGYYSGNSLLSQVKENNLPPTNFFYQLGNPGALEEADVTSTGVMLGEYDNVHFVDTNKDGLPDLIKHNLYGACQVYLSQGDGTFGSPIETLTEVMYGEEKARHFVDTNGDGLADLIKHNINSYFHVYLSQGDGTFSGPIETGTDLLYGEYSDVHFADVNGDGLSDLIKHNINGYYKVYPSLGDGRFGIEAQAVETNIGLVPNESRNIYFSDVNGDSLADLVRHSAYGYTYVNPANGDGTFGSDISSSTPLMTNEFDDRHLIDLNGDGLSDLVTSNMAGRFRVFLAKGDGTFGDAIETDTDTLTSTSRYIHFADITGDGIPDLVRLDLYGFYYVHQSLGDGNFGPGFGIQTVEMAGESGFKHFADIDGDGLSDLIKHNSAGDYKTYLAWGDPADLMRAFGEAVDNSGENRYITIVNIDYKPSTRYANQILPFIVHTVSTVTLEVATKTEDNQILVSVTHYDYSGGFYDIADREFRGFRQTVQINPDGTKVAALFLQDDWFKDRPEEAVLKDPQNTDLTRTTLTWERVFLNSPLDTCAFVKLTQKHTDIFDTPLVFTQADYTHDDSNGNLLTAVTSGTEAENVTTTSVYENYGTWVWRQKQITVEGADSGKVRETYYGHEANTGNLLSKESWLQGDTNPKEFMTYDPYGNQETLTDARGNTTTTEYDAATHTYPSRIISPETNGVSHIVENTEYDYRWGKVKASKDENGNFTYFTYDDVGRPLTADYPDGGQKEFEYDDTNSPRTVTTRTKQDSSYYMQQWEAYDGLGRKTSTVDTGEYKTTLNWLIQTDIYFDEMGRNYLVRGPYLQGAPNQITWKRTTFDYRGRPETVTSPDSEYGTVSTTFSYNGFTTTVTDPDNAQKTEIRDYLGRIVTVIEHADFEDLYTHYDYNAAGDLTTVIDHWGHVTETDFDTLGRKRAMSDPNMGLWQYAYDPNGNIKTQTDHKLQTITFDYDELNRVLTKTYSTGEPAVHYVYDSNTIPNGIGRLYSLSNTDVATLYNGYDVMGRLLGETKTIAGNPTAYTTSYRYDLMGRLETLIYPSGYEVDHYYYAKSNLFFYARGSDDTIFARYSNYTPDGKVGRIDYATVGSTTAITDLYGYEDLSKRLSRITTQVAGSAEYLQNLAYKYTRAGDIKEITDHVRDNTYTYKYDKLHRLTEELAHGYFPTTSDMTLDYIYDEATQPHAVRQVSLNGAPALDYTYDDNGNMESGPDFTDPSQIATRELTYNADNMPTSLVHHGTAVTEFVYDGEGKRAVKRIGANVTYYINQNFEVINGVPIEYIFVGNRRIARRTSSGSVFFYHKDHLGSTGVITRSNGEVLETSNYYPYGHMREHTGANISDYKFTDQEFDASTGLYNYDARLYDPVIGRFITADNVVPNRYDPQSLNRYAYVRNNPLKYIDPSGHQDEETDDWLIKDLKTYREYRSSVQTSVEAAAPAVEGVLTTLNPPLAIHTAVTGESAVLERELSRTERTVELGGVALWGLKALKWLKKVPGVRKLFTSKSGDDLYSAIQKSSTDVSNIAKHTGFKESRVKEIKDYLFNNKEWTFKDPKTAEAWNRLSQGKGTAADKTLLYHENIEMFYRNKRNMKQMDAHIKANEKFNWEELISRD